jgi:CubicO group peptidase (beta-lactamase class C family)
MKVHPLQTRVQNLLDRLTAAGTQGGLQVAIYQEGELIVDAWSGVADIRTMEPVRGDTLFPVFSVTKGMAATLAHRAVERGLIAYDRPIAEVWPEFGVQGKGGITLRQALNHSAGLPFMPQGIGFPEMADWDALCRAVAAMTPAFPPGSRSHYHAITFGTIVCETIRRVDGRSFQQQLKQDIAVPLGVEEEMFVGIPDGVEPRVAFLEEAEPPPLADDTKPSPVPGWLGTLVSFMNRPDMRRACLPASSGIMTARAIARHYGSLLPGGVDGVELLTPARVRLATASQGLLTPEGADSPWALGYACHPQWSLPGANNLGFGHGGYGGSLGFADPGRKMALGLTRNRFNKENVGDLLLQELLQ